MQNRQPPAIKTPAPAQVGKLAEALLADEGGILERSCRASAQGTNDLLWGPSKGQRTRDAYAAAPRFILLNFRSAPGRTALCPACMLPMSVWPDDDAVHGHAPLAAAHWTTTDCCGCRESG